MSVTHIMAYSEAETKAATSSNALVEIEKSRAIEETQAALVIAKKFPRDEILAHSRIIKACKRMSLATQAMYSYPKGGQTVKGASIRLMEVIAQNWGNLDFGIRELERRDGVSIAESYCWDMETNVKQRKVFEVPHEIKKGSGTKYLTDQRDIYELIANYGARRLRSCIEAIIPIDIKEDAIHQISQTLVSGSSDVSIEDRIKRMLQTFMGVGVTKEMIEKKLGHKLDVTTGEELAELITIYNSIKDKQAKREDFFEFITADKTTIAEINREPKELGGDNINSQLSAQFERKVAELAKLGVKSDGIAKRLNMTWPIDFKSLDVDQLQAVLEILTQYLDELGSV